MNTERMTKSEILERTFIQIIPADKLISRPDGTVYDCFLDLRYVYRCEIDDESSFLITENILQKTRITYEELNKAAFANTYNLKFSVTKLSDIFGGYETEVPLYGVTTSEFKYGASALLYTEIINVIKRKIDGNFIIIPSSVNDLIIVPDGVLDERDILQLLREINSNKKLVPDNIYLSDNLYKYCSDTGIIEIVDV